MCVCGGVACWVQGLIDVNRDGRCVHVTCYTANMWTQTHAHTRSERETNSRSPPHPRRRGNNRKKQTREGAYAGTAESHHRPAGLTRAA